MLRKIQPDATVSRYLFTAKPLYMFRVSQHPSSGVLKTVTAASGTGHNIGTATSLQHGLIGTLAVLILTPTGNTRNRMQDILWCFINKIIKIILVDTTAFIVKTIFAV